MMQILLRKSGETGIASLEGELDHHSAAGAREQLDEFISRENINTLVFDLKKLSFMDSSGLGVIMGRYRTMMERSSGAVEVKNVPAQVDRLFKLSGIYKIIKKAQ